MKKILTWKRIILALLVAVIAVGITVWRSHLPSTEDEDTVYMRQAYAMKALASLLTDTAKLPEDKELASVEENAPWYEPYAQYLYSRGYWEEAVHTEPANTPSGTEGTGQESGSAAAGGQSESRPISADSDQTSGQTNAANSGHTDVSASGQETVPAALDLTWELLTWGQVRRIAEELSRDGRLDGRPLLTGEAATGEWDEKFVSEEDWWDFFEVVVEALKCEHYQIIELTIYGTDKTVDITAGRMATSEGRIRYSGFEMEDYIDKSVEVRLLGSELLEVLNVTSTTVTYENVWLLGSTPDGVSVFMEGFSREFPVQALEGDYQDVLGDLTLEQGQLTKISVKRERIAGKVLAVTSDYIEIQGYGKVPLAEAARVYKIFDEVELKRLADIVVGYSVHEFIVADGQICGALALDNIEVENIRVLISNNGFEGSGHAQVSLVCDGPMRITIDNQTTEWAAGSEFTVTPESAELTKGRILVEAEEEIRITSLERSYGVPSYRGSLELDLADGKILVVNEVGLEDYLCRVVPSEMPAGHGLEALKAQAVCARSYAYNQIRANACRSQGAHVDDTTKYQVYNNSDLKEVCTQAVMETAGRVLSYGGEVITAYYSSTTCGSSTDTEIWGSTTEEYPYLIGRMLSLSEEQPDLRDEETFRAFIKNPDYETFDTEFAWYRWNLYADLTTLSNAVNASLARLGEEGSPYVLVLNEEGEFAQQPISGLGAVTSMTVTARGAGGIVSEMRIEGTEATILLLRQGNVRSYLGSRDYVIAKKDGSTVDGMASIPSAFICLEEVREGENLTGYQIYGGGYGHGVGMSQNGAKTMAAQGMDCAAILQFFYPGTDLKSIYED
ncbi:MAG: SpoIID/LytB domain-containing protein [Lachnospiraceae bacterium]|nr:SpoIID/LytB domain-containing protein [Lachnospiraceae bacterium]